MRCLLCWHLDAFPCGHAQRPSGVSGRAVLLERRPEGRPARKMEGLPARRRAGQREARAQGGWRGRGGVGVVRAARRERAEVPVAVGGVACGDKGTCNEGEGMIRGRCRRRCNSNSDCESIAPDSACMAFFSDDCPNVKFCSEQCSLSSPSAKCGSDNCYRVSVWGTSPGYSVCGSCPGTIQPKNVCSGPWWDTYLSACGSPSSLCVPGSACITDVGSYNTCLRWCKSSTDCPQSQQYCVIDGPYFNPQYVGTQKYGLCCASPDCSTP